MVNTSRIHSRGRISLTSSAKMRDLTTSWCFISWTVQTNAMVNDGSFPLQVAMNLLHSFLHTPSGYYIISWRPSTLIWIYSHPIACSMSVILLPVLWIIFYCASRLIFLVTAIAMSQLTSYCLRKHSVSADGVLDETPIVLLDSDPLVSCWGVCGAMKCWCGSAEITKMWEVLRKLITKCSGKSQGIYGMPQVRMECIWA